MLNTDFSACSEGYWCQTEKGADRTAVLLVEVLLESLQTGAWGCIFHGGVCVRARQRDGGVSSLVKSARLGRGMEI